MRRSLMKGISRIFCVAFIFTAGLLVAGCDSKKDAQRALLDPIENILPPVSEELSVPQVVSAESELSNSSLQEATLDKRWELITDIPEEPVILEDLRQVKMREGVEPPPIGTMIYPLGKLPKMKDGECGQFWIFFGDSFIDKIYACNHGDEGHQ